MNKALMNFAVVCFLLTGCTRSLLDNDDGRCPFKDRGGCQSMEMVNRMVSERRFTPDGQFVQQGSQEMFYHDIHQEK